MPFLFGSPPQTPSAPPGVPAPAMPPPSPGIQPADAGGGGGGTGALGGGGPGENRPLGGGPNWLGDLFGGPLSGILGGGGDAPPTRDQINEAHKQARIAAGTKRMHRNQGRLNARYGRSRGGGFIAQLLGQTGLSPGGDQGYGRGRPRGADDPMGRIDVPGAIFKAGGDPNRPRYRPPVV